MKKYVFTNISDSLKLSEIEKIVNANPNVAISPVQKSLNTVCIDAYYTDTQPKGVIVNLPLFDGKYITLEPKDFVTINAVTDKQCNFYDKIVIKFDYVEFKKSYYGSYCGDDNIINYVLQERFNSIIN